ILHGVVENARIHIHNDYISNIFTQTRRLPGEHLHLRITHKRRVCDYMFLDKKKDPFCMAYHRYHFVDEEDL
ncbi:hypothetical protein L9F63_026559, partial [Diploptera punctata]